MIFAPNLSNRLANLLAARGKTANFSRDLRVQDDGNGPFLAAWDAAALGPEPIQAEVDAANPAPPPPPTNAQRIDAEIAASITLQALIKLQSGDKAKTEAQVIADFESGEAVTAAPVIVPSFQYAHRCAPHEPCDNVVRLNGTPYAEPAEAPDAAHLQGGEVWQQLLEASRKLSDMDINDALAKTAADRLEDERRIARLRLAMTFPPLLWAEFWRRMMGLP